MKTSRLFVASCISLVTTSMVFAIRGDIEPAMSGAFQLSAQQMGLIWSPAFWAFTIAIFVSGALVDVVGMRALHILSAIGYLLGMSATAEFALSPYILALQIAPKVAFAPLFILWMGFTVYPKILVAVLIVFFPVLVNVLTAIRSIDFDLVNLARSFKATRAQIFWNIEFPSSMPQLFAGLRIGATLAVVGVTVGELVGGNLGLGYLLVIGQGQADTPMVFVSILMLTLIGGIAYLGVALLEGRVLHYARGRNRPPGQQA